MTVDTLDRVLIDRWGLALLLRGIGPSSTRGELLGSYVICEREYLRFLRAFGSSELPSYLVEFLDEFSHLMKRPQMIESSSGTLMDLASIKDLYGHELSLARLSPELIALIPHVSMHYATTESQAENLIYSGSNGLPFLTCFRAHSPRSWKAMFVNEIKLMNLAHDCPELTAAPSWVEEGRHS